MVKRPDGMNAFEFVVLSGLRAAQLHRGCSPRVEQAPKVAVTAQQEIAERKVVPLLRVPAVPDSPSND
jgi:DNA-directed RNA polymerase subunit K/omega